MTPEQLAASLIADVSRHDPAWFGPKNDGRYVLYEDVLAALAAAVTADLATVCCPKCNNTGWVLGPQLDKYPEEDMDSPAHEATLYICDGVVHSLLARIAAQEAQIKGLEAADLASGILLIKEATTSLERLSRAEAAETALAAERAKVAKLAEAVGYLITDMVLADKEDLQSVRNARAAITEAGQ